MGIANATVTLAAERHFQFSWEGVDNNVHKQVTLASYGVPARASPGRQSANIAEIIYLLMSYGSMHRQAESRPRK
jgi:hypothetical protein